ncbi:hypothetical protein PISL3812_08193 [Talaromyces islandicus]|uniref:Uncharacterized protein n=1 Tax=Talaromyces islandicus TaxID=28573 RepID=A0A0U1M6C5_TALIS|nr:hypothetical protein PISL3812_08193 [Talaromyces islandicus]
MGLLRTGLIGAIGYQIGKKGNSHQEDSTPPPPQQHYYYPAGYQPQMNYTSGPQQYQQQPQPHPQNGYQQYYQPQCNQPQFNQPQYNPSQNGHSQNRSMNVEGSTPPPYVESGVPTSRRNEKSPVSGRNPYQQ